MSLVLQLNSRCIQPGCIRDAKDGHVIYRTSPKGTPFEGKCGSHFLGMPEEFMYRRFL